MLRHLELIDDEAAEYEVKMVKIDDPLMAKKYGHRDLLGLGFFRQGNFIKYEGNPCLKTQYFQPILTPKVQFKAKIDGKNMGIANHPVWASLDKEISSNMKVSPA